MFATAFLNVSVSLVHRTCVVCNYRFYNEMMSEMTDIMIVFTFLFLTVFVVLFP